MLRRLLFAFAAVVIVAAGQQSLVAFADSPVNCPTGEVWRRSARTCVIAVSALGSRAASGTESVTQGRRAGGTSSGSAQAAECTSPFSGEEIPCRTSEGWWSRGWRCYVKALSPQPPLSAAVWQGHEDGAVYSCVSPGVVGTGLSQRWSLTPPAGPAAPPDPRVLAQQAVAAMRLRAVNVGIVPEPAPGRVGLVGLPTWMWVKDPSASSWGPVSRSVSAGGFSVTATGRVDRVVWSMGDGSTVVCRTPGTPYADAFGKRSSPDCGHQYVRQGVYTVRATSYWVVAWSGIGQSGEIPLQFTRSAVITMGEAQVLTTG